MAVLAEDAHLARVLEECCAALHDPRTTAAARAAANGRLVEVATNVGTNNAPACARLLEARHPPLAPAVALVAAGVVSEAARGADAATSVDLIRLSGRVAPHAPAAARRLAQAAVTIAADGRQEDAFLRCADVLTLDPSLRLAVVAMLGRPEELCARPSAVAARRCAVDHVVGAAPLSVASLRALAAWAACGLGLNDLDSRLVDAALDTLRRLRLDDGGAAIDLAAAAATALRDCATASCDLGDELDLTDHAALLSCVMSLVPAFFCGGAAAKRGGAMESDAAEETRGALAALGASFLETAADSIDADLRTNKTAGMGRLVVDMALTCLAHPSPAVAEAAVQGLEGFIRGLPRDAPYARDLGLAVVGRCVDRAAFVPGCSDVDGIIIIVDADLAEAFRAHFAAPLLHLLSDRLGAAAWFPEMAQRVAAARDADAFDAALFAVAQSSSRTTVVDWPSSSASDGGEALRAAALVRQGYAHFFPEEPPPPPPPPFEDASTGRLTRRSTSPLARSAAFYAPRALAVFENHTRASGAPPPG